MNRRHFFALGLGGFASLTTEQVSAQAPPSPLNIYAAASLKDVLPPLVAAYEKAYSPVRIQVLFAASDNLVTQAIAGKPADVFLFADDLSMSRAITANLVNASETHVFATNALILLTSKPASGLSSLRDPAVFKRVMIANPSNSPAGRYAREVLSFAGIWNDIQGRIVFANDSRKVMEYVNAGEVDAAIVYRSDKMALKPSDEGKKKPWTVTGLSGGTSIRFVVAPTVNSTKLEHAKRFVQLVRSDPARAILLQNEFYPL